MNMREREKRFIFNLFHSNFFFLCSPILFSIIDKIIITFIHSSYVWPQTSLSLGVRCLCGIAWNCVKLIYDCLSYGLFDSFFFFSHRHFLLRVFFVTLPVLDAFAKKFIRFSGVCRPCVCVDYAFFYFIEFSPPIR